MALHRTILASLLSLALAFAPIVSVAMAKPCGNAAQMIDGATGGTDCPCDKSMPHCGTMPQCQTVSGCASQCFTSCGIVSSVARQFTPDHGAMKIIEGIRLSSHSIKPPAPPPRV